MCYCPKWPTTPIDKITTIRSMQNTVRWRSDRLDGAVNLRCSGEPLVKQKWCKCRGLWLHSTNVTILLNYGNGTPAMFTSQYNLKLRGKHWISWFPPVHCVSVWPASKAHSDIKFFRWSCVILPMSSYCKTLRNWFDRLHRYQLLQSWSWFLPLSGRPGGTFSNQVRSNLWGGCNLPQVQIGYLYTMVKDP